MPDESSLEIWIEGCCYEAPDSPVRAVELWRAYKQWTKACSLRCESRKAFYGFLASRYALEGRPCVCSGLELKPEDEWDYYEPDEMRSVYFISDGKRVKIGVSQNPRARLAELQTGCPYRLEILGCVRGGYGLERSLHEKFRECRVVGEWFDIQVDEIRGILEGLMEEKKG